MKTLTVNPRKLKMAFKFPNVMDMFRGGTPMGNPNDPNINKPGETFESPNTAPNGVVPPQNEEKKVQEPTSPMAEFEKLWENPVEDPNKPTQKSALDFEVDPKLMMEAAGKVDFASAIPTDLMQKISAGGEDGVRASIMAMNIIAQKTYGQSAMATAAIVKEAVKAARNEFRDEIPALLKAQNLNSALQDDNPLFSNPAVVPIMSGLKDQLLIKYPTATPAQLTEMAKKYVTKFAESFAPKQKTTPKGKLAGGEEDDWEDFLTS
jgi:hypothetical protein